MYLTFIQALSDIISEYGIIGAVIIVAVGIIYYFFNPNGPQTDYDGPMMQQDKVLDMIKNYRKHHWSKSNERDCFHENKDAYSVRFELEQLKDFILNIEKSQSGQNQTLGIRFYFAAYSEDEPNCSNDYSYSNCHTLVMIPTRLEGSEHKDFNANNTNSPSFLLDQRFFELNNSNNLDQNISALNKGTLFPPMD